MSSYLPAVPAQGGYLPYFLLFGAAAGIYNAIQGHLSQWQTEEVYSGKKEVTPLTARIFGLYTLAVSGVRLVAAYHITDPAVYSLGLYVYALALGHFTLEAVVFGTVKLNRASLGPFIIATTGVTWMTMQKAYYTGA